jgi:acrylyl-CoA reductase (NADPH)
VALLANLGYKVTASTGRPDTHDYLKSLGAAAFIDRTELAKAPPRPLDSERWGGAIDSVGGTTLATLITQLAYRASVASCGLAGGSDLALTVLPFLLRGVNLLGIDSVMCPLDRRRDAWDRLSRDLPKDKLEAITQTIPLDSVGDWASRILKGAVRGRLVVAVTP